MIGRTPVCLCRAFNVIYCKAWFGISGSQHQLAKVNPKTTVRVALRGFAQGREPAEPEEREISDNVEMSLDNKSASQMFAASDTRDTARGMAVECVDVSEIQDEWLSMERRVKNRKLRPKGSNTKPGQLSRQ